MISLNKTLSHLPKQKQNELKRIAAVILRAYDDDEMIILFGSYARGDWKDRPHQQGRGRLTIHKKSDDILVPYVLRERTTTDGPPTRVTSPIGCA